MACKAPRYCWHLWEGCIVRSGLESHPLRQIRSFVFNYLHRASGFRVRSRAAPAFLRLKICLPTNSKSRGCVFGPRGWSRHPVRRRRFFAGRRYSKGGRRLETGPPLSSAKDHAAMASSPVTSGIATMRPATGDITGRGAGESLFQMRPRAHVVRDVVGQHALQPRGAQHIT